MVEIREHSSPKYTPRTYFNAKTADVTLAIAVDLSTAGEKCTHKAAGDKYIGFQIDKDTDYLEVARGLYKFMKARQAKTLNVAGNGIYTLAKYGINQEWINRFVCNVIAKVDEFNPIETIYSGGQTGVDMAGAVAANIVGIDATITLPKGYIQRFEDKVDVCQSYEDVERQLKTMTANLRKE